MVAGLERATDDFAAAEAGAAAAEGATGAATAGFGAGIAAAGAATFAAGDTAAVGEVALAGAAADHSFTP